MDNTNKATINFDNGTWNYVAKEVNLSTYQINYITKNGFDCYESAYAGYEKDLEKYVNDMTRIKKAVGMQFTFSGYLNYWFKNILQPYAFGSYQAGCAWVIYDVIIPSIEKDVLLSMITTSYINQLLKKCSKLCKTSGHEARKIISLVIKDAISDGYLQTNPMEGVDHYPCNVPDVVVFSKEEIKKLLAAAYQYHSIYLEVLLAMFCGLRQGEILGLKYSDFDFEEKTVDIKRQITRDYDVNVIDDASYKIHSSKQTVKPPKSFSSYRTLRVPDIILEEVRKRKRENEEKREKARYYEDRWQEYLCLGKNGNIKSYSTYLAALNNICTRCGLQKTGLHGLRHVYASILIEQNVPLEKISKLMGHKSVSTTFEVYCGIVQAKEHIRKYVDSNLNPQNAVLHSGTEGGH